MISLLNTLKTFYPVHEVLSQRLYHIVSDKPYKRSDYFLRAGEVDRHIWFIEKGLVIILRNGKVTYILDDGHFVIATDSFSTGCPTKDDILVLEDTLTWRTTRTDLMETCEKIPDFWHHYTSIEGFYRKMESNFNTLSAKEKFDDLWEKRPDFFYRVKKEYLASYLGMSVSTFENFRRGKQP